MGYSLMGSLDLRRQAHHLHLHDLAPPYAGLFSAPCPPRRAREPALGAPRPWRARKSAVRFTPLVARRRRLPSAVPGFGRARAGAGRHAALINPIQRDAVGGELDRLLGRDAFQTRLVGPPCGL